MKFGLLVLLLVPIVVFAQYGPIDARNLGLITFTPQGGTNSQSLSQAFGGRVVTANGAIAPATVTDHIIEINQGTPAAENISLPSCADNAGLVLVFIDGSGTAAVDNITLIPSAGNINGQSSFAMNFNRQVANVWYDGSQCVVFP